MKLGTALADEFTVYLPDRRGRGMNGPYGPHYSIEREDEDLDAIVSDTGARHVFGEADGGLFALHGALNVPAIRKVAVFEPALFVGQRGLDEFKASRNERRLSTGSLGEVMAGLTKGAGSDPRGRSISAPYRLLVWAFSQPAVCSMLLWVDARLSMGDNVALRDLIPALKPELGSGQGHRGNHRRLQEGDCGGASTVRRGSPAAFQRNPRCPREGAAAGQLALNCPR
jgi:pimeloyl-ACP methyl ester carboxylesterase